MTDMATAVPSSRRLGVWATTRSASRQVGERLLIPLVLLLVWQLLTVRAESVFFPPPLEIFQRASELWLSGGPERLFLTDEVFENVLPSIARLLGGWVLACLVGVPLGVLIGRSRTTSEYVAPLMHFLRAIPPPAIVPIFFIVLGSGSLMRITLIAFGSIWPILLNTVDGVRGVDRLQLETAEAFGIPPRRRLQHVVLPAASPQILAGLRVSLALALILMVVSELSASTNGIGFAIIQAQRLLALTDMWAGILLLGILGWGLNTLFLRVERRLLSWHRGQRRYAA